MKTSIIRDKQKILDFLLKEPELQLYLIGDLDDFFWPHTTWYCLSDKNEPEVVGLLYSGMDTPTFLLFQSKDDGSGKELIRSIKSVLPEKFNVHLSPGLLEIFGSQNIIKDYGQNLRMILKRNPEAVSDENIRRLSRNDLDKIENLFNVSYPDNWFDSRMLETGKYFGYFTEKMLTGIAGVHVYSDKYRIAALGNITTHPGYRGRKIAYKLTSYLCTDLKKTVTLIGLNVKSDNMAAIKCYENIGFEITGRYDECLVRN